MRNAGYTRFKKLVSEKETVTIAELAEIKGEIFKSLRDIKKRYENQLVGWIRGNLSNLEVMSNDRCNADWSVRGERVHQMTEFAGDRSNLFFLLMSVVECTRSRRFIRQSLASETTQQKFEKLQLQSVKLIAMYDLQGSWDLLVKYRADGADSSPRLVANIIAEILKEAKSEDDKMRKKPLFWQADLIDVARQSKSFRGLLELDPNEVVSYTRLASTAEYGVHRAQRSFLIMEAPDDDTQRRLFVEEIHELMALTPQLGGMKHELAHALFFMHPEYRRSVMSLLKCYDTKSMEDKLTMLGYCRQVLKDEVHAYVLAEPREIPEADRQRLAPLRKELQKLYRRYSRLEMT